MNGVKTTPRADVADILTPDMLSRGRSRATTSITAALVVGSPLSYGSETATAKTIDVAFMMPSVASAMFRLLPTRDMRSCRALRPTWLPERIAQEPLMVFAAPVVLREAVVEFPLSTTVTVLIEIVDTGTERKHAIPRRSSNASDGKETEAKVTLLENCTVKSTCERERECV